MSPRRARNRSKDFIPRGLDLFGEGIGLVWWNPWLDVTPTFCKNKIFCANWSAYKNAYQIIVLVQNFPKIILHRMHCMAWHIIFF
jgi:hypothetical protein